MLFADHHWTAQGMTASLPAVDGRHSTMHGRRTARGELRQRVAVSPRVDTKPVNLALQGGGAHGAFTWGVLDRLLEDERVGFDGISATSAGAMNATVFSYGMVAGGRNGAKTALAAFWRRISQAASMSPLQATPLERLFGYHSMANLPGFVFLDLMTRLFSPYEFNPLNLNPIEQPRPTHRVWRKLFLRLIATRRFPPSPTRNCAPHCMGTKSPILPVTGARKPPWIFSAGPGVNPAQRRIIFGGTNDRRFPIA
ncbi:MAG: Patatin [Rhodospirillales bacterium]|jgi:hypothetical protein|nr:Patatin [Rhodospirillales bacterium]